MQTRHARRAFAAITSVTAVSSSGWAGSPDQGGIVCASSAYRSTFNPLGIDSERDPEYFHVEMSGTVAFVSYEDRDGTGIISFDVSDPATPRWLDLVPIVDLHSFVVEDGRMYVGHTQFGSEIVGVYDITNPEDIVRLGLTTIDYEADSIAAVSEIVYVFNGPNIVRLDTAEPQAIIDRWNYVAEGSSVASADGDSVFVVSQSRRELTIIDYSNWEVPVVVATVATDPSLSTPTHVVASEDLVAVCSRSGMQLFDISNPASPVSVSVASIAALMGDFTHHPGDSVEDFRLFGNNAYLVFSASGVFRFDVSDPTQPVMTGQQMTPGYPLGVAADEDLVLVADGPCGVAVIDGSSLNSVRAVASVTPTPWADDNDIRQIVVDGDTAYASVENRGLLIYDIADPIHPVLLGQYDIPASQSVYSVAARGGYVYLARDEVGLEIVDATDPANPIRHLTLNTFGEVMRVLLDGDTLGVITSNDLIVLLNVSDPSSPQLTGLLTDEVLWRPEAIVLRDGMLYIPTMADDPDDFPVLRTIDISDPLRPVRAAYPTRELYEDISIDGQMLYAVSDRDAPTLYASRLDALHQADSIVAADWLERVVAADGALYLPGYDGSLRLYSPTFEKPHMIGGVQTGGELWDFAVAGDVVFGLAGSALVTLDASRTCGACPADFNSDGAANFFDIAAFIDAYNGGLPDGDYDGNGVFNFFDVADFLKVYTAGCP